LTDDTDLLPASVMAVKKTLKLKFTTKKRLKRCKIQ